MTTEGVSKKDMTRHLQADSNVPEITEVDGLNSRSGVAPGSPRLSRVQFAVGYLKESG